MKDFNETLASLHKKYASLYEGKVATYIPELSKTDPDLFAIAIVTTNGEIFKFGDADHQFSLQSTSKPFVYGLALEDQGRKLVHSRVGVEPTGNAFNSIVELESKSNKPYNPMINSGAITATNLIKGKNPQEKLDRLLMAFQKYIGHEVKIDEKVFQSEKNTAHRNRSIAHLLRHFNVIDDAIDESLDLYFKQCSILVNTVDMATMAATLATGGINPLTQVQAIDSTYIKDILGLMFTCGMYDSAGEWAYSVGLPAKSGVSGGIFCVVPGKMGIAVYSPLLDSKGHSVRGVKVIHELSEIYGLNIFSQTRN